MEKKEVKELKKEDMIKETLIVNELPQTQVRNIVGEDGKTYVCITINEALKEILDTLKDLKKGLVGN